MLFFFNAGLTRLFFRLNFKVQMPAKRPRGYVNAAKTSRQKTIKKRSSSSAEKAGDECPGPPPSAVSTSTPTSSEASESDPSVVAELEAAILSLLRSRRPGTTCCPSEVPRRMLLGEKRGRGTGGGDRDWRRQMPAVREAAARLAERGQLEITQGGVAVPGPREFRGPIRLRLVLGREETAGL